MIINEIKDIVLDIIMNIENRELSTCPDDINNNSQYTDENEIIVLPPNQTSPKAEPEVITISSDEETMQDAIPSPFDNFMDANIPPSSQPKPRRTRKNSKSIKIVVSTHAKAIKSCLKKPTNPPSIVKKIIRFNPKGSVTHIPSIDEKANEKQIKSQSRSKSLK